MIIVLYLVFMLLFVGIAIEVNDELVIAALFWPIGLPVILLVSAGLYIGKLLKGQE